MKFSDNRSQMSSLLKMSVTLSQSPSHQFYLFICLLIVRALLYSSSWSETHCGDQASLEFLIPNNFLAFASEVLGF